MARPSCVGSIETLITGAGRLAAEEGAQSDDQIIELQDGLSGIDATNSPGKIRGEAFGGAGQYNVACFWIEEDVLNASQTGEVAHFVSRLSARREFVLKGGFEAVERYLAQRRPLYKILIEAGTGRGEALLVQLAGGIGEASHPHDAVGIYEHSADAAEQVSSIVIVVVIVIPVAKLCGDGIRGKRAQEDEHCGQERYNWAMRHERWHGDTLLKKRRPLGSK